MRTRALLLTVVACAAVAAAGSVIARTPIAEFGVLGQGVQIDPNYTCIVCHAEKRRAFLLGVHSERGIRCHDCHGGDPTAFEARPAHSTSDFVGTPTKLEIVQLCGSCHEDPDRMRQYGLHIGQLAEFRSSRHGQLLLQQGNMDAPTCTDCHDAHTILPPNDARSNVYPTNIVRTCARCHEDEALMGRYGLPTDQVREHRESAHGKALFEHANFAAPTCVDCHGSHAALPPNVVQISDVCGHCHVLVRRAFYEGPHGAAALRGALPGCTACHSNHGTERVGAAEIANTCTECHAADSPPALFGIQIQEDVTSATENLARAAEAIHEMARAGRNTQDIAFRYETALTAYAQIGQFQHSLDMNHLDDLTRQVASIATDIRAAEEVTREHLWEHKLMLIPVWFLTLSAIVLAWFKLRAPEKGSR